MKSHLETIASQLSEKGLPSKDEMRAKLETQRESEFFISLQSKLSEYKTLFERWSTSGPGELSDEETKRMFSLSDEFERLAEIQGKQQ